MRYNISILELQIVLRCLQKIPLFFLKEYQEAFSEEDLQRETALNKFLLAQAFPTAGFIKDENGNMYHFLNGRYVVLQEYIRPPRKLPKHRLTCPFAVMLCPFSLKYIQYSCGKWTSPDSKIAASYGTSPVSEEV